MTRITESRNPLSVGIDLKPINEILEIINKEDTKITEVIHSQLPRITEAVEKMVSTIDLGGNVYLVGSGTSGRLCVLEAAEIPPTFGLQHDRFKAVIAGGVKAIYSSVEAAEDDEIKASSEMEALGLNDSDIVIGVTASGSTPYVIGALKKANQLGATTVGISCNTGALLSKMVGTSRVSRWT
jgi:N-acetylmuramic acid 6-phosphate etherase